MSQQPPSPYGGPPGDYPPGNYPLQGPGQPPGGMSNKAKFWIGVALAIPGMVVAGVISGAGTAVVDGLGGDPGLGAVVSGLIGLLLLAGFIAMIVFPRTRWIALGMLAGAAILFILAAGACVVLIVALNNSYG
ncbi:MAG: hypothetical protein ABIR34_08720 [Marmoricola sp.]